MQLRLRFWVTALIVASGLGLAPCASAQQLKLASIDLQIFRPAMDSKGYITLNSSQVLGQLDFSFGLVSTWGSKVLDFTNPNVTVMTPSGPAHGRFAINNIIPFWHRAWRRHTHGDSVGTRVSDRSQHQRDVHHR